MSEEEEKRKLRMRLDRKFGMSRDDAERSRRPFPSESDPKKSPKTEFSEDHKRFPKREPYGDGEQERRPRMNGRGGGGGRAPRFGHERSFGGRSSSRFDNRRGEHRSERHAGFAPEPEIEIPPWMKKVLALATDKGREREEMFLAEGQKCVQEMLQYHHDLIQEVFVDQEQKEHLSSLVAAAEERRIRLNQVSAAEMKQMSTTVTNQGILAVVRSAGTRPDYEMAKVLTLVDGVQDPGNLGSLFRTSLGFAQGGVLLGKGTVNPFNPKVVRGSSGTFLRVPFEQSVDLLERIMFLRNKGFTVLATDLHAKQGLDEIPLRKLRKVAFLVGNEGAGADFKHIQHADEVIKIPMSQTLESLNVAVAHGIMSFQIAQLRQQIK